MKIRTYIKFLPFVISMIFLTTSCEDDASEFVASESTPIVLEELPISEIAIDGSNPSNPAVTFNWSNADYSQAVVENYALEFSSDQSFTNPVQVASSVGVSSASLTMSDLNGRVSAAGLPPLLMNPVYARVISSIGVQAELQSVSNIISFNATPYFNYDFSDFYLVGNGTLADWNNNNNNPPLFRDPNDSDFYTYTGFFTKGGGGFDDGRFKILETRGMWQPQWGNAASEGSDNVSGTGEVAGNPGTQSSDPGRFGVPSDGYFTFTIDFDELTYTIDSYDATGAVDFTDVTVQGSALSDDTAMQQTAFDPHLWYINNVALQSGDLQIVTNTGAAWGGSSAFSGVATEGGSSIPVLVQANYEIWFNDLTGDYIMIPLNL
ncbi:SusF/SusE family outer membrane protein [Subsaximicrobium wynnwilliamsii]|uniref:SusF/SusE family outer membrane protein n=1 Tax=Subsaximicrobium wynnwilliamsii TaxID=291179 RepID=A0A5C6ZLJ6_9FLAO|nr:SusE domain-containing protein [Subsaximicrobium wynnwilliamsii]TXD85556.1 SusF/SusE family outer membrane protein [Subsaximicrobium wynnwilliamsii]TXD90909.1 SusF/SusE family outer membrane protein [Subsaximicrobium wynnwilliamsii]TXE05416.1 SusF/SusE family outer membrane protein [Subsaximicrobium wynnwilliamsii]